MPKVTAKPLTAAHFDNDYHVVDMRKIDKHYDADYLKWRNGIVQRSRVMARKGKAVTFKQALAKEFDPNQPRDERGRWTGSGGGVAGALTPKQQAEFDDMSDFVWRDVETELSNSDNEGQSLEDIAYDVARGRGVSDKVARAIARSMVDAGAWPDWGTERWKW